MFKTLQVLLMVLMPVLTYAQDCPEGYKCVPDAKAAEIADILDLHNCMVRESTSGDMQLNWAPNDIVITDSGQVFAQSDTLATLHWCTWHLEFRGKTGVTVSRKSVEEPVWGLRLRVKLGVAFLPTLLLDGSNFTSTLDPMLLLEPFFYRYWHIQVHAGLKTFGLGLGMDVTKNADVFIGVGLGYLSAEITPMLGISLSFN